MERSGRNSAAPLLGEIFLDSVAGLQRQTVSLCSAAAKAEVAEPQGHGPHLFC